jgi:hypothetical protein
VSRFPGRHNGWPARAGMKRARVRPRFQDVLRIRGCAGRVARHEYVAGHEADGEEPAGSADQMSRLMPARCGYWRRVPG